jgi:hypothetical protein
LFKTLRDSLKALRADAQTQPPGKPENEVVTVRCGNDDEAGAVDRHVMTGVSVMSVLATLLVLWDAREEGGGGGAAGLPLLFVCFGFVSYVKQQAKATQSAIGYASMHVAEYAPAVFISSFFGFGLASGGLASGEIPGECFLLPLGLSTWIPSLRNNDVNSLVWIAGAFVFNSLLFLPLRDAISKLSPSVSTRLGLLLCCWVATAWQALDWIGMRLFLLDRFTAAVYLRAYTPCFVAGVLLASLHTDSVHSSKPRCTSVASLLALLSFGAVMYADSFIPTSGWLAIYIRGWVHTGLYLPLICLFLYGATSPRSADPVGALCYALTPLGRCASLCPVALFFEQPVYRVVVLALNHLTTEMQLLSYAALLVLVTATIHFVSNPVKLAVRRLLPEDGYAVHATYRESGRTPQEYPGVQLFLYYGSFVVIVVTFCMAQKVIYVCIMYLLRYIYAPTRARASFLSRSLALAHAQVPFLLSFEG